MKSMIRKMAAWCVMAAVAMVMGCGKPVDKGLFENRKAENCLEEARQDAAMGRYDEALKFLEEAETHADLALRLTSSRSIANMAEMNKKEIANWRSQIQAKKMQAEAEKTKRAAEDAGLGAAGKQGDDFWKRGTAAGAVGEAGAGGVKADLTAEEAAARRAKLGERGGRANVENVSEDEFVRKPAAKPSGEAGVQTTVGAATGEAVVINKIERKNKAVVVYVTFNNRGRGSALGSVTGSMRNENGQEIGPMLFGFFKKGFKPNWDDIFASEGEGLAAGEATVSEGGSIELVLVGQVNDPSQVKSAVVTVTLQNENTYSGKGP